MSRSTETKLSQLGLDMEPGAKCFKQCLFAPPGLGYIHSDQSILGDSRSGASLLRDPLNALFFENSYCSGQLIPLNTVSTVTVAWSTTSQSLRSISSGNTVIQFASRNVSLSDAVIKFALLPVKKFRRQFLIVFRERKAFETSTQSLGFLLIVAIL